MKITYRQYLQKRNFLVKAILNNSYKKSYPKSAKQTLPVFKF